MSDFDADAVQQERSVTQCVQESESVTTLEPRLVIKTELLATVSPSASVDAGGQCSNRVAATLNPLLSYTPVKALVIGSMQVAPVLTAEGSVLAKCLKENRNSNESGPENKKPVALKATGSLGSD